MELNSLRNVSVKYKWKSQRLQVKIKINIRSDLNACQIIRNQNQFKFLQYIQKQKNNIMSTDNTENDKNQNDRQKYQILTMENNNPPLIKIQPIYIENKLAILIIKTILQIINIFISLHFFLSFTRLEPQPQPQSQYASFLNNYFKNLLAGRIGTFIFTLSIISSFIIIQNIIFYSLLQVKSYRILNFLNRRFNIILSVTVEINITLTAIVLIEEDLRLPKLALLILLCLIDAFIVIFMQCLSKPTDLLHSNNHIFVIVFRVAYLILLLSNIINYLFTIDNIYVVALTAVCFIIIFHFYRHSGYRTYNHWISKICLLLVVSFFLSNCIIIFISYFSVSSLMNAALTFIMVFIILAAILQSKSKIAFNMNQYDLEDLKELVDSFRESTQKGRFDGKCFLVGLLEMHRQNKCPNFYCYSHKQVVYCAEFEAEIRVDNIGRYESILRYLIKCLFEQLILTSPQNREILLTYCEFTYNQMKNILPLAIHLQRLQKMSLSLYQRMRLFNLKKCLREDMKKLNHINYHSEVDFQRVISFDEIYNKINYANYEVIEMNIELWENLSLPNISVHSILTSIQQIEQNCRVLQTYWRQVEEYLYCWHKIRRLFAFYSLFINNKFKKQKEIKKLQSIFTGSNLQDTTDVKNNRTSILQDDIFKDSSLIIHTTLHLEKLIIKKCSKSVNTILGYTNEEVKLCDLSIVMPKFFKQYHEGKFRGWMEDGFVNFEKFERGVDIFCLDKYQKLVHVTKTFKLFINQRSEVQFVCLMIHESTKQCSAICSRDELIIEEASAQFLQYFELNLTDLVIDSSKRSMESLLPSLREHMIEFEQLKDKDRIFQCYLKSNDKFFRIEIQRINYGEQKLLFVVQVNNQPSTHIIQLHSSQHTIQNEKSRRQAFKLLQAQEIMVCNIFRKEQSYTPSKSMKEMQIIKYILHTFFTILLIIFVVIVAISNQNYIQLEEYIHQHVTMIKIARQPFLLGIRYYEVMTDLENPATLDSFIKINTDDFLGLIQGSVFLRTLFDQSIFSIDYSSIHSASNSSAVQHFENKDIIFLLSSAITSLNFNSGKFEDIDYQNFHRTIYPAYYNIITSAKTKMYLAYSTLYSNISVPNNILLEFQSGLFILVITLVTLNYIKFCKKLKEIFKILVNIDHHELQSIKQYWFELQRRYSSLEKAKVKHRVIKQVKDTKKIIQNGKQLKNTERCIFLIAVFSLSIKFFITAALEVFISSDLADLEAFGNIGQAYFNYYPSNLVAGYGIIQKYYEYETTNTSSPNLLQFSDVLNEISELGTFLYMPSTDSTSPFYAALKQYYFSNPCVFNPTILTDLNITVEDCTRNGGHLSNGIVSFERQFRNLASGYLNNSIQLSKEEIYNLTKWNIVVNDYVEDLINIWGNEFTAKVEAVRSSSIYMYCFMFFLIIVIHYLIAHKSFLRKLLEYYEQYTHAYGVLVTNSIIQKNKIIKSELISFGFIRE